MRPRPTYDSALRHLAVLTLVVATGCTLRRLDVAGKACADDHPCPAGYLCQDGVCATGESGGDSPGDTDDGDGGDVNPGPPIDTLVTVDPLYPAAGRDWNDYVLNDGPDTASAADQPCPVGTPSYGGCIHGGERRKVVVSNESSCAGLTLNEALGLFDWECRDGSGTATFLTTRLHDGRGLRDLVTASGFVTNSVVVKDKDGNTAVHSDASVWGWQNVVVPLPPSTSAVTTLDQAKTIYYADSSSTAFGYTIAADGVAIVGAPGVVVSRSASATQNCNLSSGTSASADGICLIASGAHRFAWLEVDMTSPAGADDALVLGVGLTFSTILGSHIAGASTTANCVNLASSSGSNRLERVEVSDCRYGAHVSSSGNVMRHLTAHDHLSAGVALAGGQNNELRNIVLYSSAANLLLSSSNNNRVVHVLSAHAGAFGIDLEGGQNNVLSDLRVFETAAADASSGFGIYLHGDRQSIVTDAVVSASHAHGLMAHQSTDDTLFGMTLANNAEGMFIFRSSSIVTGQLATVGNITGTFVGGSGSSATSNDCTVTNVFSANNSNKDVVVDWGGGHQFEGDLWVGSSKCFVDTASTTAPGLTDGTCVPADASTATLVTDNDASASFVAKVTTDDTANADDINGAAGYSAITDWADSESGFRGWGVDGSAWPNPNDATDCISGKTCRIYDWRLHASDTQVRGRVGAPSCDTPDGGHVITDHMSNTFLVSAVEIFDDSVGDDDGLCEAHEACVYSPNLGAYQGEGGLVSLGTFGCGAVTGVDLFGYAVNGVP